MEQLWDLKEESIRDIKWRPAGRRTGGRTKRSRKKEVKQEDVSKNGMGFRLRGRGVWDECGQVPESVRRGEELFNGEERRVVWGEENVGDIVCGHEIRNT